MMTDDKQHEYVSQIAPGVLDARLQVRELKADLHQANHDHTELLIERNNLTEALRQVNARLVKVTAERDAQNRANEALYSAYDGMRTERNAALLRVSELVSGLSEIEDNDDLSIDPIRLQAVIDAFTRIGEAERDAARQWARAWKCKMKRERASYRLLLRAHIPLIEQCRRGTKKRDELRADLKITSRKLNAELVRGVGLEQQLAALKAERDIEPLRWQAGRVPTLEDNLAALAEQLAAAKITITSLTSERDALAVNFAAAVKSLEIYSGALQDDRK